MIIRELQPFEAVVDATALSGTLETAVIDLGSALTFREEEIHGTDRPLLRTGAKLILAAAGLTGSGYLTVTIYTGKDGVTAATEAQSFTVYLDAYNHTVELPLATELIRRSLKIVLGGVSYTTGTIWIVAENILVPAPEGEDEEEEAVVVPTPAFSRTDNTVTITAEGADIYYTTDGSTPTSSSTVYTGAITLTSASTTISAIAYIGSTASEVATETFELITVANPVISQTDNTITITCSTEGATIRYTDSSSTPSTTNGEIYSGPFEIYASGTIMAIAYIGGVTSSVVSATVSFVSVPTPTITVENNTVTITSSGSDAIYYTTDGSDPSTSSTRYTGTFALEQSGTIKAIAYIGGVASEIASASATFITVTTPTITVSDNTVTITASGADSIYYTTDGTTPSKSNGSLYSSPFSITSSGTISAIAYIGDVASSVATASATFIMVTAPTVTMANNIVTITAESDASIYYTTDGTTEPTSASTQYTAPFTITADTTVKAIAYIGTVASSVTTQAFSLITVDAPTISQSYNTITITSSGADSIYYTTDESTPSSSNGTAYSGAFTITASGTIKAIAYKGTVASSVTTQEVTLFEVATPVISISSGTVTITCETDGASIYYTTDGSTPTDASTLYEGSFTVSDGDTVNAIAYVAGIASSVATETYTAE